MVRPPKSRKIGSTTATFWPRPSIIQWRGPLSLTATAPSSAAMASASRRPHNSGGQSLSIWVPKTSASNAEFRWNTAMTSP